MATANDITDTLARAHIRRALPAVGKAYNALTDLLRGTFSSNPMLGMVLDQFNNSPDVWDKGLTELLSQLNLNDADLDAALSKLKASLDVGEKPDASVKIEQSIGMVSGGTVSVIGSQVNYGGAVAAGGEVVQPLKILFLAANPKDTDALRLSEEVRAIDQNLRMAEFRDRFELEQQWAVRVSDIQGYLLRHKPHVVHFSGHGSDKGEILLEDDSGMSAPVSEKALSSLFRILKDNIRCVVLNACWSAQQADAIAREIDCVVGMTRQISDGAAIHFAGSFYQGLGYARSVQTAFDLATNSIDLTGLNEVDTPNLLTKTGVQAESVFLIENV